MTVARQALPMRIRNKALTAHRLRDAGVPVLAEACGAEAAAERARVEGSAGGPSVWVVAVLMWCAAAATPALDFRFPASFLSSASLALLGAVICLSGVVSFRRAKTTVNPMRPDSTSSLVVSGIYQYTRNPMYLGFLLLLLGWAIFQSNLAPFALIPAFVVHMNHFQIGPEERALGSLFAQEYQGVPCQSFDGGYRI